MTYIPNSIEARDVASLVHMQTNLRKHQREGPLVIARGDGCRVYDNSGCEYIESIAGLWCASLGFASERLAKVAYEQMRSLGSYHLYRHRSSEPAIGEIMDVLVSSDGKIDALIVGVGGFVGAGEKDVAVNFDAVKKTTKNDKVYLTMNASKDALKSAPGFKYDSQKTTWVPDTSSKAAQ